MQYIEFFQALNITDIFWSHATRDSVTDIDGVRIHPFPLYPAQSPVLASSDMLFRQRKHLANFIGAFNPTIYLTNVREAIFALEGTADDLLIIQRRNWHYNRAVYDEQIGGQVANAQQLKTEEENAHEYIEAIRNSWFTLCPTGSGPNSIRVFESLALGSIPIILSTDLLLAGPPGLWSRAAIIEEDSRAGLDRALERARALDEETCKSMLTAGALLFETVAPAAYGDLICKVIEDW